jgi:hypothetical protein
VPILFHPWSILLPHKVEKNRVSPKTWYRDFFQIGKFESAANQNDPVEIEHNRGRKFLQFLENFSGRDIYRGGVEVGSAELITRKENYES